MWRRPSHSPNPTSNRGFISNFCSFDWRRIFGFPSRTCDMSAKKLNAVHSTQRRPDPAFEKFLDNVMKRKQEPCYDEQPMHGRPSCDIKNFRRPKLRKFPHDPATLEFSSRIDGGMDGFVWRVRCNGRQYALKMASPPPGSVAHNCVFLRFPHSSFGTSNRPKGQSTGHSSESARLGQFSI